MKRISSVLLAIVVWWNIPGFSQTERFYQTEPVSDVNWPNLQAEGQMVQLRWVLAGQKMKFFFIGYEGATLNLENMTIEATDQGRRKIIPVEKEDDYFLISNPSGLREVRLRISEEGEEEVQEVNIQLE